MRLHANATNAQTATHTYLKATLADMMTVRCPECGGWGHTKTRCPTRTKLLSLSRGQPTVTHLLRDVREKLSHDDRGPVQVLGKRPRVNVGDGGFIGFRNQ